MTSSQKVRGLLRFLSTFKFKKISKIHKTRYNNVNITHLAWRACKAVGN